METTNNNQLVKQYEPLINKITAQFFNKTVFDWDSIKSMAYEGFALAIKNYDPERSNMNFMQYAAYSIRNNILNCLDNELRTVKLSNYAQQKSVEKGESLFNTIPINNMIDSSLDFIVSPDKIKLQQMINDTNIEYEINKKDSLGLLLEYIKHNFKYVQYKQFCMYYGLEGYEEHSNKEIANLFKVTPSTVSQNIHKIIDYIKKNKNLKNLLK